MLLASLLLLLPAAACAPAAVSGTAAFAVLICSSSPRVVAWEQALLVLAPAAVGRCDPATATSINEQLSDQSCSAAACCFCFYSSHRIVWSLAALQRYNVSLSLTAVTNLKNHWGFSMLALLLQGGPSTDVERPQIGDAWHVLHVPSSDAQNIANHPAERPPVPAVVMSAGFFPLQLLQTPLASQHLQDRLAAQLAALPPPPAAAGQQLC
jgi:hypothetical protein